MEAIKNQLNSSKIQERRKAVKEITKLKLVEFSEDIFNLFKIEKEKNKSWEIQCELLDSLGILKYLPSKILVETICKENIKHNMITHKASGCFLRLSRNDLSDIRPIKELLNFGDFSVVSGVLDTLSIDRMVFSNEDLHFLIIFMSDFANKNEREKGYSDVRSGLVNACAGFEKSEVVLEFLKNCLKSEYDPTGAG